MNKPFLLKFALVMATCFLTNGCQFKTVKTIEEVAAEEQFKLDSMEAAEIMAAESIYLSDDGPADSEIQDIGQIVSISNINGINYQVKVEYPNRKSPDEFLLNLENLGLKTTLLDSLVGKEVNFYYTETVKNQLVDLFLDGISLIENGNVEDIDDLKSVTGILKLMPESNQEIFILQVETPEGNRIHFEIVSNEGIREAIDKEVTFYFTKTTILEITNLKY